MLLYKNNKSGERDIHEWFGDLELLMDSQIQNFGDCKAAIIIPHPSSFGTIKHLPL